MQANFESQNSARYRKTVLEYNDRFLPVYDMGRLRNSQIVFYNVERALKYDYWTFFRRRIEPHSDDWRYAKGTGQLCCHMGIKARGGKVYRQQRQATG